MVSKIADLVILVILGFRMGSKITYCAVLELSCAKGFQERPRELEDSVRRARG